ncbi:MAG TPA: FadR/GntR family transcriptional regulator [Streptosporangiaceae bacterium]
MTRGGPSRAYPRRGQHGRVVHTLGARIAGGDFVPGEPMPTEEELVGELGVGRSALREAMKVLGAKGLVESRTRAGTRVRPREAWHLLDPDVLGWRYRHAPAASDLDDLAGLRVALEPGAARLAAERATPAGVRGIEEALAAMRASVGDPVPFVEADLAFHAAVFEASGNALLVHLHQMMAIALAAVRPVHTRDPARYAAAVGQHERVLAAIRRHHAHKAAESMRLLVEGARDDLRFYTGQPDR